MLSTAFTRALHIEHPIALAPMGGVSGGALTAAVAAAGGLGLLGGARADRDWISAELAVLRARTARRWGIGFQTWAVDVGTIAWALDQGPAAVMLSFGDPEPFAARIRDAGVALILQVTDEDEARRARDLGADVIVAQGDDAGGHGGRRPLGTMSFTPAVVDLAGGVPVLAAGGVADGRGLAAALALGAAGALIGTRFQASQEALITPELGQALLAATGADTARNRALDVARGSAWPERYPARTLRNAFLDEWDGREEELAANPEARQRYLDDPALHPIWAGQGVGLVTAIEPAEALVAAIAADAERALSRGLSTVEPPPDRG